MSARLLKIFLIFFCLNTSNLWAKDCKNSELYPDVSLSDLKNLVAQKKATIIDVNSSESFQKNHIPGAIHYSSNQSHFEKMLPEKKDTLIIAYCGGPSCTAWKKAAEQACQLGYTQVKHFKGGLKEWTSAG